MVFNWTAKIPKKVFSDKFLIKIFLTSPAYPWIVKNIFYFCDIVK